MNDLPRQVLVDLLARHGIGLCESPKQLEDLLQEGCGAHCREILVLIGALHQGVPQQLESLATSPNPELLVSIVAERLANRIGLSTVAARWAVETWGAALEGARNASLEDELDLPVGGRSIDGVSQSSSLAIDPGVTTLDRKLAGHATVAVLVVAPDGTGDHPSIADAILAAEPGSRIVVRPGTYRESLVIDRHVEIAGDGPAERIVVEGGTAPCIQMNTDYAVVRQMTFRGSSTTSDPAIDLPRGCLVMEECDIASGDGPCVAIHGLGTRPALRLCRIHDSMQDGIVVFLDAEGLIERCEIQGNARAGITIRDGGNPHVSRCRIEDSGQAGVEVLTRGQGTLKQCEISSGHVAGIVIGPGGRTVVLDCTIRSEQGRGIWIQEGGAGRIEGCDLSGAVDEEIRVDPDGRATLRSNRSRDGIVSSLPRTLSDSLRLGAKAGVVVGTILGLMRGVGSILYSGMIGEKPFGTAVGAFLGSIRALTVANLPTMGACILFGMAFETLTWYLMERRRLSRRGE